MATLSDDHLPRGVSASTTGVFVLDVLALATMAACVPTLKLFVKKKRHWNLVSGRAFRACLSTSLILSAPFSPRALPCCRSRNSPS